MDHPRDGWRFDLCRPLVRRPNDYPSHARVLAALESLAQSCGFRSLADLRATVARYRIGDRLVI